VAQVVVHAWQVQGPEFKPHTAKKQNKTKKPTNQKKKKNPNQTKTTRKHSFDGSGHFVVLFVLN
jgi:hypothetical protein